MSSTKSTRRDGSLQSVERFIVSAPMPLAQLARRARNAKTGTAVLQNAAHYLGEAGAALAASYWSARALEREGATNEAVRRQLGGLLGRGATFGAWVGLWRECVAATSGEALAAASKPLSDIGPLEAVAAALESVREALGESCDDLLASLRQARKRGVLGVFEFLAMFRNRIYGHGTMLAEQTCQRLAGPFLALVVHALGQHCVFEGAWLGRTQIDLLSDGQERYWLRLHGVAETTVDDGDSAPASADVTPGALHFISDARSLSLDFWVVQDEDATGLSRFGFFQRALHGRKRAASAFHGIEYLDYLGGRFRHDNQLAVLSERALAWLMPEGAGQGPGGEPGGAPGDDEEPRSANERRFGDFVIESELGRGAMGIVYRATQVSLGRQVALKVLPPTLASDPIALGRFHREVQALGRCDHANVVRVLASGIEEGRPWFAMELVEGADLSEVFATLASWKGADSALTAAHLSAASSSASARRRERRERRERRAGRAPTDDPVVPHTTDERPVALPVDTPDAARTDEGRDAGLYRQLALLFAEAADGVEEIHRRGLVHRDLKPANIMLSADGERLVVMDLGLAKSSDASVSYTRQSGSEFVGSARYAAPEQVQAKLLVVDHRADVYSLGATLYELVTLRPLYPAQEIAELLQQKLSSDPVPARSHEPAVPRELDIILAKALARRPEDRYASAADLAADLRAFASHRPIQARPPSPYEYLRLFYHRQQRLVHIGAIALLAILGVLVASLVLIAAERSRAVAERDNAERARVTAEKERDRAETLAAFVFDDLYQRLEPMGKTDLFTDVTASMVAYYESRDLERPEVAMRYAEALRRSGQAVHLKGEVDAAYQRYRVALEILEDLRRSGHIERDIHQALALTYYDLAGASFNQNRLDDALEYAQKSLELRTWLHQVAPDEPAYRRALAQSHRQMGVAMERKGDLQEALAAYHQAVTFAESVARSERGDRLTLTELAMNRMSVGDTLDTLGQSGDALTEYQLSLSTLSDLNRADPLDTRVSRQLATNHDNIASVLRRVGDYQGALAAYQRALAIREELARHDPTRASWQRDLAASHGNIARVRAWEGKLEDAQRSYQRSLDIMRSLAERYPTDMTWQMDIAINQNNLGGVLFQKRELDEALAHYRDSLEVSTRVAEADPANAEFQYHASACHGLIAEVLAAQGKLDQALESTSRRREILERLVDQDGNNMTWQSHLVGAHHMAGDLLARKGRHERALDQYDKALALQGQALAVALGSPEWRARQRVRAEIEKAKARSSAALGRLDDAIRALDQARQLVEYLDGAASRVREIERSIERLRRRRASGARDAPLAAELPESAMPRVETQPIQSRSRKAEIYE